MYALVESTTHVRGDPLHDQGTLYTNRGPSTRSLAAVGTELNMNSNNVQLYSQVESTAVNCNITNS